MTTNVRALAALTIGLLAFAAPAGAQEARPAAPPLLTVTGEGVVTRAPDRATISLQIVTNNDAASAATSQNNAIYAALRTRLGAIGIAESAMHTTSFGMNFVPKPSADANAYRPPRTGYVVTRGLAISVDDLDAVGRAIDAAVAAGASDLGSVSYGLRDQRSAYAAALAAAMKDAQMQAAALADAAGLHPGGIRTINAGSSFPVSPSPVFRTMSAAAAPVPTEIQPSAVEVRATVSVTYTLVR